MSLPEHIDLIHTATGEVDGFTYRGVVIARHPRRGGASDDTSYTVDAGGVATRFRLLKDALQYIDRLRDRSH